MIKNANGLSDFFTVSHSNIKLSWNSNKFSSGKFLIEFLKDLSDSVSATKYDWAQIILIAMIMHCLRTIITKIVFTKLLAFLPYDKRKRNNFLEYLWMIIFYTFTTVMNAYFVKKYNILNGRNLILMIHRPLNSIPFKLQSLRLIQTSHYVYCFYRLIYIDKVKDDAPIMGLHHLLTISLQMISYSNGFVYIGVAIEFLHDINDILLNTTKLLYYIRAEKFMIYIKYANLIVDHERAMVVHDHKSYNRIPYYRLSKKRFDKSIHFFYLERIK
ncbi:hypothetical protein HZS_2884, partial [Henneguya salminicola]